MTTAKENEGKHNSEAGEVTVSFQISVYTLAIMDASVKNIIAGNVSGPLDLHKFSAWILVTSVMRGNAPFSPLFLEHVFAFECSCDIIINSYITGLSTINTIKNYTAACKRRTLCYRH